MSEQSSNPKIVVFGAGAIGCFVGGGWLDAGLDVSFIGRQRIADEIGQFGLTLSDYNGWKTHLEPSAVDFQTSGEALLAEADLIALSVKNTGSEDAAKDIAEYAKPDTPVLSLQNGVNNVERLQGFLPGREIYAGMVPYNVAALGEGKWHRGTTGHVMVQKAPLTEVILNKLGDHPVKLSLEDDMVSIVWGKLLMNLNNAVNALSGLLLREQLMQRGYRRVVAASIRETLGVLKKAGITPAKVSSLPPATLPSFFEAPDAIYHPIAKDRVDAKATSSMADDFAAGRLTEIDYLNGGVVQLADSLGEDAPVNKKIIALIKSAEQGGKRDWTADELVKEVLG